MCKKKKKKISVDFIVPNCPSEQIILQSKQELLNSGSIAQRSPSSKR